MYDPTDMTTADPVVPTAEDREAAPPSSTESPMTETVEASVTEENNEVAGLRAELARLEEELAQKEALYQQQTALTRELEEFSELFPAVSLKDIPIEVRSAAEEQGIPLAAAYALYEKKREAQMARTRTVNRRNAENTPGRAGIGEAGEFFTPDEVRRMSPREVHANFKTIRESMKKWN